MDFIGKGIGFEVMKSFMKIIPEKFTNIFVDPEISNIAAIKTYKRAGFIKITSEIEDKVVFMIKSR